MKSVRDVLQGAKELIERTGWNQGTYAMKNGKTLYNFTSGEADSYCLVGAIEKTARDLYRECRVMVHEGGLASDYFTRLAHRASHLVIDLEGFMGCPADWNDQNEEQDQLNAFVAELKQKQVPRDQAKKEINEFKQALKKRNMPPTMTKERVLMALQRAIDACSPNYDEGETW